MLTISDLSWTGTRWEIRTKDGFVGLDELLSEKDEKIEQLQMEIDADNDCFMEHIALVSAERDAAMEYIPRDCGTCKHWRPRTDSPCTAPAGIPCKHRKRQAWQWRGLEMEDGKSE